MESTEDRSALAERVGTAYADRDASSPRAEAAQEERRAAEKPEASGEIVIEEISIDGMCGVY